MSDEMDMSIDLTTLGDYKEKLIPVGNYHVRITKSTLGIAVKTNRPKIDMHAIILDTVPAGEDLSGIEDDFEFPIEKMVFPSIYFPKLGDKPYSANIMMKILANYVKHFNIQVDDPNNLKAFAKAFVGAEGGVIVKYEPSERDDKDSDPRVTVKSSTSIE